MKVFTVAKELLLTDVNNEIGFRAARLFSEKTGDTSSAMAVKNDVEKP